MIVDIRINQFVRLKFGSIFGKRKKK